MSSVDLKAVDKACKLADVLRLLDWAPTQRHGRTSRGVCPLRGCQSRHNMPFSVKGEEWYCHTCREGGGPLRLYCRFTGQAVSNVSATALCKRLGHPVPSNPRGERTSNR